MPTVKVDPSIPHDVANLAYIGGVFDGEGTILIYANQKGTPRRPRCTFAPMVAMGMADVQAINLISKMFGGHVFLIDPTIKRTGAFSKKFQIRWRINSRGAVNFLHEIIPYLRIKKAQAELVLMFHEKYSSKGAKTGPKGFTQEEIDERFRVVDQIKELKKQTMSEIEFMKAMVK